MVSSRLKTLRLQSSPATGPSGPNASPGPPIVEFGLNAVAPALVIYMVAPLDDPFRGANGLRPTYLLNAREQMVVP